MTSIQCLLKSLLKIYLKTFEAIRLFKNKIYLIKEKIRRLISNHQVKRKCCGKNKILNKIQLISM